MSVLEQAVFNCFLISSVVFDEVVSHLNEGEGFCSVLITSISDSLLDAVDVGDWSGSWRTQNLGNLADWCCILTERRSSRRGLGVGVIDLGSRAALSKNFSVIPLSHDWFFQTDESLVQLRRLSLFREEGGVTGLLWVTLCGVDGFEDKISVMIWSICEVRSLLLLFEIWGADLGSSDITSKKSSLPVELKGKYRVR